MGVIKDGSISGFLSDNKVFAVNYPGYPSSMERALITLGGPESISKVRKSPSTNLELHFRPEDPYSHPVFGELVPCNNFLLKISKNNPKVIQTEGAIGHLEKDEGQLSEGTEDEICADIVGHVFETYYFNGMVDYQHVLGVHADVARKKKRNWSDVEPQFEKHGLIDADQEDLMILLPPVFSLKNIPENIVLKPSMYVSLKKKQEGIVQHHWEKDIDPSLAIDFFIKDILILIYILNFIYFFHIFIVTTFYTIYSLTNIIIHVPKKVNWEKYIQKGTHDWKCQMAVCDSFEERPIWKKESLSEYLASKGLIIGENFIRRLLFRAAYYFSNGPFLRFWIRKGYDPRKDPESRIYQRIDFRVPPPLRSYCDNGIAAGLKHKWKDLCSFEAFPYKCQISLQLFELADDYIQQEIRKPVTQTTCTLATGWFPLQIHEIFRLCVSVRFLSVYPDPGAEPFVKSATARFEKAKRTKTFIKCNQNELQPLNKDEVHIEEKEMSNGEEDDDNDNDDDMEDDLEEDFEELDTAGDGTNSLPEPSYMNEENISKNYLQDLFGSFPYNGGNGDSDGEYQIYDQYSDGNDSDDDY